MRAFSNATIGDQPTASNRRQPVRQTRTNPARNATNVVQPQAGALTQAPDGDRNANPGFYPAITHFTDAITALPKEMIRHYTMLKEVDAKTHGPEALLGQYLNAALKAPGPFQQQAPRTQANRAENATQTAASNGPSSAETTGNGSQPNGYDDPANLARRGHFHNMRLALLEMLQTLDEKNHVLNTAIDSLDKQMKRCNSSYPHIEDEISEEARYGSLTHWAYTEKSAEKKGMIAGERTRRAANTAAAAAAQQEAEGAAMRSEARREALATRKHRNQHLDSDFDDGRAISKNPKSGGKGRKAADANLGPPSGLGILNGAAPPNKRRKVEKASGSLPAERAMASVYGANGGAGRGLAGSPRDIPGNDAAGKKRGRGGSLAVNGTGRKRTNTNASAINSPSLASSPVVATFAAAKDRGGKSPAPSMMQRLPSARARQNSTQSVVQLARNRSSSTNVRATNGNSLHGTTADVEKVSGLTGRSLGDVKSSMKETVNAKGEHLVEDTGTGDGAGDLRGALVVGSRNPDRLKREETENGSSRGRGDRPPSLSVSTRGGNGKGPSKTATPINTSFAEPHRTRGPRASDAPLKRSHKKGAGLAAQIAAAAAAQDGEDSSMQVEEDEDDGPGQERYCYCEEVSYGEMVGCDGDNCEREWFHLECVGLSRAPAKNAKWYCDECKEKVKSAKFNGGNGR